MPIFEILKRFCTIEQMPLMAYRQGVAGVLYEEVRKQEPCPLESEGLMDLVAYMEDQKVRWDTQKRNIGYLAKMCQMNGLRMMIFKGLALSQLYDNPISRKRGDVDVFFVEASPKSSPKGKDLLSAGDRIDALVRQGGVEVTPGWKHSSFDVHETHVENHRQFVDWDEHPRLKVVDDYLKASLQLSDSEEAPVFFPPPNFNAVLLPVHMGQHFVYEGASLRQLVDWAVFLEKCGDQVDWDTVYRLADEGGYRLWLDVLNAIACDYFGASPKSSPKGKDSRSTKSRELEERVMQELAESKPFDRKARKHHRLRYLWGRTIMAVHNRWKLRMVYDENSLRWYLRHAWRFVTDKSEK